MVHFTSPDFLFNIRHLLQSWSLLIIYVVPVRNYKDCLLIALISTDYVRGYYHAAAFVASRLLIIFPLNKLVFEQKFEPSFDHPSFQPEIRNSSWWEKVAPVRRGHDDK